MMLKDTYTEGKVISKPHDVKDMVEYMAKLDREHLVVIGLNARNKVVYKETEAIGTLDTLHMTAREVFKRAIVESAGSIIMVHNHPSGDREPSEEDKNVTRQMVEAGKIIGIKVIDSLIVTNDGITSVLDYM